MSTRPTLAYLQRWCPPLLLPEWNAPSITSHVSACRHALHAADTGNGGEGMCTPNGSPAAWWYLCITW